MRRGPSRMQASSKARRLSRWRPSSRAPNRRSLRAGPFPSRALHFFSRRPIRRENEARSSECSCPGTSRPSEICPKLLHAGVKARSVEAYRCQVHLTSGPVLRKIALGEYLKRILVSLDRLIEQRIGVGPTGSSGLILQYISQGKLREGPGLRQIGPGTYFKRILVSRYGLAEQRKRLVSARRVLPLPSPSARGWLVHLPTPWAVRLWCRPEAHSGKPSTPHREEDLPCLRWCDFPRSPARFRGRLQSTPRIQADRLWCKPQERSCRPQRPR